MSLSQGRPECPVCGDSRLVEVLRQWDVPVHQNLVLATRSAALSITRGDLDMCACERCGFVYNRAFDASKLSYGPQYENTQLSSPAFQNYASELVRHMVDERHVRDATIVEVGCGKGAFLRALVTAAGANNSGVGFDPSFVGPDVELDGRLRFERRFYDATCTGVAADVVVCRHVIEHVTDPVDLLQAIHTALQGRIDARLFLETPSAEWILRNTVISDLFYEHCSLFTAQALASACGRAGFAVQATRPVFGEQYVWLEAGNGPAGHISFEPGGIAELGRQFASAHASQVETWQARIKDLVRTQRLAIWGAGAKGVTFANLLDPRAQYFACVVDVNPAKQGSYLAGTGHSIVAPNELGDHGVTCVVVLNPNYRLEVQAELASLRLSVDILDLGIR